MKADIGLIGLAVMGQNLVLNMNDKGFSVAVYNRTVSKIDDFLAGAASEKRDDPGCPPPRGARFRAQTPVEGDAQGKGG